MQKLLDIILLAIAAVANLKQSLADTRKALADRDALISDLKGQLDTANADHQALLDRATAAEAHSAQLESGLPDVNAKADELATALNDEPTTHSVDPATFAVTAEPTQAPDAAPAPAAAAGDAAPAPAGDSAGTATT